MSNTKSMLRKCGLAALFVGLMPTSAAAFCGFYVGGADSEMFNDATEVVLMRAGTKTVLSMRNRYEGDPDNFAMVVPVPVVLQEANVKTLNNEIFDKIDTLGSPRLVEYWQQDPCAEDDFGLERNAVPSAVDSTNDASPGNVQVEAQFTVGEYNIVILSAEDGTALDTYFEDNDYAVPPGAADYYQPYIDSGNYFFVAEVDSSKVTFENGKAILSPLRFDYESQDFSLPIRLGLINSNGQQDLIVNILADGQRYEVANYPNVTIPTNIEVVDDVRNDFGSFYRALFARTLKENPAAAVTEYSWAASGCDPCPGPVALGQEDFMTLGQDTLDNNNERGWYDWTLTRIHTRYDKDQVGEDLVFRKASPIVGGREIRDEGGNLETGVSPSEWQNAFQGRYIIRHKWDKPITCDDPNFERWGADPESDDPWGNPGVTAAQGPNTTGGEVFSTNESRPIERLVRDDIPEISVVAMPGAKNPPQAGCSATRFERSYGPAAILVLFFFWVGIRRRRDAVSTQHSNDWLQ
jgi:hypothetical protein